MTETGQNGNEPRFEGKQFNLGGTVYVVPSLSVKQAKRFWEDITELDFLEVDQKDRTKLKEFSRLIPTHWDKMVPIIHAAMSRNYPNLKVEELEEMLDVTNIWGLMRTVVGASGVTARPGTQPAVVPTAT